MVSDFVKMTERVKKMSYMSKKMCIFAQFLIDNKKI